MNLKQLSLPELEAVLSPLGASPTVVRKVFAAVFAWTWGGEEFLWAKAGGGATRLMSGDVIVIPQRKLFK